MLQNYPVSNCVSCLMVYRVGCILILKALCTFGLVVTEGDSLTLPCAMYEGIYPKWTGPDFTGTIIRYSYVEFHILNRNLGEQSKRLTWDIRNNKSLIIQNIRMNDSGVYTCSNGTQILETYNVSVRENEHREWKAYVALFAGPFCGSVAVVVYVVWKRRPTDNTRRGRTSVKSDTVQSQESGRPTAGTDKDERQYYNDNEDPHAYEEIGDTDENNKYESLSTGNRTTLSEITYGNLQI